MRLTGPAVRDSASVNAHRHAHTHLSHTPGTASYLPFGSVCVSAEHKSADELKMRENAKSKQ